MDPLDLQDLLATWDRAAGRCLLDRLLVLHLLTLVLLLEGNGGLLGLLRDLLRRLLLLLLHMPKEALRLWMQPICHLKRP